jgi:hypothetical protein
LVNGLELISFLLKSDVSKRAVTLCSEFAFARLLVMTQLTEK